MEFYSTTEVTNRRYSKFLKILLGVICFLDVFVVMIEFVTAGEIEFTFIVPLIILIPAFVKMGPKKYTADVLCNLYISSDCVKLIMSNVLIDKHEVLSRSYVLDKETLSVFSNSEHGKIFLVGNGKVGFLSQTGNIVYQQDFENETIELIPKKTYFEEMENLLKDFMKNPN